MRRALWSCGAVLVLLAALMACLAGGLGGPPPAEAATTAPPTPRPSPTIVSEITSKETMYSNTYRLSDGSYQAQIFSLPIRFKNAQGVWQSFNTNLVSSGIAGAYHAANLPVVLTIGSAAGGTAPTSLAADGYTVTWSVRGLAAGVPVAPGPSAASYLGVATDTTLSYKALNWGVEQSLLLSSAAAPASFTCTLSHPGLTLVKDSQGRWGLYAPGDPSPIFLLSDIDVNDASGAACATATMTVSPGSDSSTLTYTRAD